MSPDETTTRRTAPIVVEIAVHNGPISGIVASPDGSRLMVTNYGRDSVSVIDTDTWPGRGDGRGRPSEPFAIAMGGDTDRAYVSTVSPAYDSIEVIDMSTNTVVATHPLALSVSDLVVSADGRYVYASRNGAGGADVAVLDTTTGQVEVIDLARPGTTTAMRARQPRRGPPVRRHQRARPAGARRDRRAVRRPFRGGARWRRKSPPAQATQG